MESHGYKIATASGWPIIASSGWLIDEGLLPHRAVFCQRLDTENGKFAVWSQIINDDGSTTCSLGDYADGITSAWSKFIKRMEKHQLPEEHVQIGLRSKEKDDKECLEVYQAWKAAYEARKDTKDHADAADSPST